MKGAYLILIFAAVLTLTGCGWRNGVSKKILDVGPSTRNEEIREKLLRYTPKGTDGTNVLKFVVDDLQPKEGCVTYFAYFEAFRKSRPDWEKKRIVCFDPTPSAIANGSTPRREIFAAIGEYPDLSIFYTIRVYWSFDGNDKLTDVVVGRERNH